MLDLDTLRVGCRRPPRVTRLTKRAVLSTVQLLVLTVACSSHFEVPVPAVAPSTPPPPIEAATIALPVSVPLSSVRAQLESRFPVADSIDQVRCVGLGGAVCHQYVYRRDSLELQMTGDRLTMLTRLRYRGRVAVPKVGGLGSCGYAPEQMRRAELRFSTALYWRLDWRLATRNTSLAANLLDACEVTFLKVDATPLMRRIIDGQLADLTHQIDSAFPSLADLRPSADSLWRAMQTPTSLDSTETTWLVMNPEAVSLVPPSGVNGLVTTGVLLTAHPRVVVGSRPAATSLSLPTLTLARPSQGLHVPVEIELPFADLSARATTLLSGQTAGQDERVNDVKMWGVGDTAVIRVGIAGKVNGALYLVGRLAYDDSTRTLLIQDLRYTVASGDAMSRIKVTLGAGLVRRAVEEATGHGHLDVGAQLDSMRTVLNQQLNRPLAPGISIAGEVEQVRVVGLYTTQTAFLLRVVLDGRASLGMQ